MNEMVYYQSLYIPRELQVKRNFYLKRFLQPDQSVTPKTEDTTTAEPPRYRNLSMGNSLR